MRELADMIWNVNDGQVGEIADRVSRMMGLRNEKMKIMTLYGDRMKSSTCTSSQAPLRWGI
jgi:tRNA A37 threonylcarbamoyltransferase TsaD